MALKRLNTEHYIAIGYLALPKKGGKTVAQIAEECEVTERTIYNWLKEPLFEKELKAEMIRNSRDKLPELLASLAEIAIEDKNAAMAKLALQVNGMLTDKYEIEAVDNGKGIDREAIKERLERLRASDIE
jgi:predicted transcriptional regulator